MGGGDDTDDMDDTDDTDDMDDMDDMDDIVADGAGQADQYPLQQG